MEIWQVHGEEVGKCLRKCSFPKSSSLLCVWCWLTLFVRPQDLQILKFRHPTPGGSPASGAGGVRVTEGKKSQEKKVREREREGENYWEDEDKKLHKITTKKETPREEQKLSKHSVLERENFGNIPGRAKRRREPFGEMDLGRQTTVRNEAKHAGWQGKKWW